MRSSVKKVNPFQCDQIWVFFKQFAPYLRGYLLNYGRLIFLLNWAQPSAHNKLRYWRVFQSPIQQYLIENNLNPHAN